jgi:hypothetical protein
MIKQLHYTSLRDGPSGHSGFQFCARGEGLGEATLRWVERMTAYERPRDIDAGAELAQFPVNLMYARLDPPGLAMVAQVVYTGQDFSQRPGNYFAHALVTDDLRGDLGDLQPAQLWGAPFWQTAPGPSSVLPDLATLVPGGADIAAMAEAISVPGDPVLRLAWLLAAADAAMNGGPQVLLVGASSQSVWRWTAAVSCLLGPVLAGDMTFCTYSHDPARAGTHLVGTVTASPGAAASRGNFTVIDLVTAAGPGPEEAPRGAALLAGAGLDAVARAWPVAVRLGPPAGSGLVSWYPLLACALMSLGHELAVPDLDAAVAWLTRQPGQPELHCPVAASVAGQRIGSLSPDRQAQLVEFTRSIAGDSAAGDVEAAIVRDSAQQLVSSGSPTAIMQLVTSAGLAEGLAIGSRLLSEVGQGLRLGVLRWAGQAGAGLDSEAVQEAGRDVAAALLLGQAGPADVRAAALEWPALRAGMIDRLGALPETAVNRILGQLTADTFQLSDFAGLPALGERWVSARAVRRGDRPVQEFIDVCALRRLAGRNPAADTALVRRLWPHGSWTAAEAGAVTRALPPAELLMPPVLDLLVRVLRDPGAPAREDRDEWLSVARVAATWPPELRDEQGIGFAQQLSWYATRIRQVLDGTLSPGLMIRQLIGDYEAAAPEVQRYLTVEIPALILYEHPQPHTVLGSLSTDLASGFITMAGQHMAAQPHDLQMAAALYACKLRLQAAKGRTNKWISGQIDEVLAPAAVDWDRKEIATFSQLAEQLEKGAADNFRSWIRYYKPQRPSFFRRSS